MTKDELRRFTEQMLANPAHDIHMDRLEKSAVERMIAAKTDQERMEAQAYVRAARSFRSDCEASARNTRPRKGAPA